MPRLIWVFAGCTCHIVGFVMRRLILFLWLKYCRVKTYSIPKFLIISRGNPSARNISLEKKVHIPVNLKQWRGRPSAFVMTVDQESIMSHIFSQYLSLFLPRLGQTMVLGTPYGPDNTNQNSKVHVHCEKKSKLSWSFHVPTGAGQCV